MCGLQLQVWNHGNYFFPAANSPIYFRVLRVLHTPAANSPIYFRVLRVLHIPAANSPIFFRVLRVLHTPAANSPISFRVLQVLDTPVDAAIGGCKLPNNTCGSDHISLVCDLQRIINNDWILYIKLCTFWPHIFGNNLKISLWILAVYIILTSLPWRNHRLLPFMTSW